MGKFKKHKKMVVSAGQTSAVSTAAKADSPAAKSVSSGLSAVKAASPALKATSPAFKATSPAVKAASSAVKSGLSAVKAALPMDSKRIENRVKKVKKRDKSKAKFEQKLNRKKFKEKKKEEEEWEDIEDEFTLDLVKELGGNEEDFQLLQDLPETEQEVEELEEDDYEQDTRALTDTDQLELKKLIKSLNLKQYAVGLVVPDNSVEVGEKSAKIKMEENEKPRPSKQLQDSEVSSTTPSSNHILVEETARKGPEFHFVKTTPSRSHCVIRTNEKWYAATASATLAAATESGSPEVNLTYWVPKIEKYAQQAWDLEIKNYEEARKQGTDKADAAWISTVLKSGTLSDKMSAYVVLVQTSPIHNLATLQQLINFVTLKSRRPCLMAIDTLQQLFLSELLIEDRKLRPFDRNPFGQLQQLSGGNKDTRDRYLITWLFEDRLRNLYQQFLDNLSLVGKDTIEKTRVKVISCMYGLLAGNPEQEQQLLERLVNKLGDPTRAVAAKAMYHLTLLLENHPAMKDVLVREVEYLLYRPNISPKAQYYGICFLSQILLRKESSSKLAAKLVEIYFSFFKLSIKKGEVETKLMSALLTGVNRAFPYAALDPTQLDQQLETMHKLVHMVNFNTAVQALTLLFQILDSRDSVNDRFYCALYKKLADPALSSSSRQVMFINLLFNAIKKDPAANRVRAFIKRILQVCEYQPANLVCGLLYLIAEVLRLRPELGSLHTTVAAATAAPDLSKFEEDDDEEEHYEDVKEEEEGEDMEKKRLDRADVKPILPGWSFVSKSGANKEKTGYDPQSRNPLFAGAERSHLWEVASLGRHFHPSVALFAGNLATGTPIKYSGDPLTDFTLAKFLDRFVFRNPKKNPEKNKPATVLGKRNVYRPTGIKAIAPDSKEFLNRDIASVPGDELFLYKYFQAKAEKKGEDKEDDTASVTSEEFNNFLDSMGGRAKDFEEEDGLDFAAGISDKETGKRKARNDDEEDVGDEESDEDDNEPEDDEGSDEEPEGLDGETSDGFQSLSDSEDGEGGDEVGDGVDVRHDPDDDDEEFDEEGFGGDSEEEELAPKRAKKKGGKKAKTASQEMDFDEEMEETPAKKNKKTKFAKFDPNDLQSLLADAEEFSHLIDQNEESGMSTNYSTSDKASKKQLSWERDREDFMHNKNWKQIKKQQRKQLPRQKQQWKQRSGQGKQPPKKKQKR